MATFTRKRKPPDGKRYGWYKDCLRLDFEFRCAYCLIHEADYQGHESFQIDHFRPKSRFPRLAKQYANLYYACQLCNRRNHKGDHWPEPHEKAKGQRFVDPCADDWEDHVEFAEDGSVRPITPAGDYSVRTIALDRPYLRDHRAKFPGEYFVRSELRRTESRLDRILALAEGRTGLSQEMQALLRGFSSLQASVNEAWARKKPLPPEPRCPY